MCSTTTSYKAVSRNLGSNDRKAARDRRWDRANHHAAAHHFARRIARPRHGKHVNHLDRRLWYKLAIGAEEHTGHTDILDLPFAPLLVSRRTVTYDRWNRKASRPFSLAVDLSCPGLIGRFHGLDAAGEEYEESGIIRICHSGTRDLAAF